MLLFIVASVNIGIFITPAPTQFSAKPSILQKPLLLFYCVSTVSNNCNCAPVHLRKHWCQSHVDLKKIYTYVFVTLLKKTNVQKREERQGVAWMQGRNLREI